MTVGHGEIGPYRLVSRIALGGMAELFLARHVGLEGFERFVAIKRILPHLSHDEEFVHMFRDEARLVAKLSHPNIVQIYDLGRSKDSYYIAMEYVSGRNLGLVHRRARQEGVRVPPAYVAWWLAQAADALNYAHQFADPFGNALGIVHRDVSPQNILLTFSGSIKLVDFGIAKAASKITKTRAGVLKGKYGYMSPEQIRGDEDIDGRSDVFALGVVLFELLVGRRPFDRETAVQTLRTIVSEPHPDPSLLAGTIPSGLVDIIDRALQKRPGDRFQSARDMQLALEDFTSASGERCSSITVADWMRSLFRVEGPGTSADLPPASVDMQPRDPASTEAPSVLDDVLGEMTVASGVEPEVDEWSVSRETPLVEVDSLNRPDNDNLAMFKPDFAREDPKSGGGDDSSSGEGESRTPHIESEMYGDDVFEPWAEATLAQPTEFDEPQAPHPVFFEKTVGIDEELSRYFASQCRFPVDDGASAKDPSVAPNVVFDSPEADAKRPVEDSGLRALWQPVEPMPSNVAVSNVDADPDPPTPLVLSLDEPVRDGMSAPNAALLSGGPASMPTPLGLPDALANVGSTRVPPAAMSLSEILGGNVLSPPSVPPLSTERKNAARAQHPSAENDAPPARIAQAPSLRRPSRSSVRGDALPPDGPVPPTRAPALATLGPSSRHPSMLPTVGARPFAPPLSSTPPSVQPVLSSWRAQKLWQRFGLSGPQFLILSLCLVATGILLAMIMHVKLAAPALEIITEPDDARVTVNGDAILGPNPRRIQVRPDREYTFVIEREGFQRQQQTIRIPPDRRSMSARFVLRAQAKEPAAGSRTPASGLSEESSATP